MIQSRRVWFTAATCVSLLTSGRSFNQFPRTGRVTPRSSIFPIRIFTRFTALYSDFNADPSRVDGQGEWSDWLGANYDEDDEDDGEDFVGFGSGFSELLSAKQKMESLLAAKKKNVAAVNTTTATSTKQSAVVPAPIVTAAASDRYEISAKSSGLWGSENKREDSLASKNEGENPFDSSSLKSTSTYKFSAAEWGADWSEEAPYFDEDDVQDDEGNWGRESASDAVESPNASGLKKGSSDLWTRYGHLQPDYSSGSSTTQQIGGAVPTEPADSTDLRGEVNTATRADTWTETGVGGGAREEREEARLNWSRGGRESDGMQYLLLMSEMNRRIDRLEDVIRSTSAPSSGVVAAPFSSDVVIVAISYVVSLGVVAALEVLIHNHNSL